MTPMSASGQPIDSAILALGSPAPFRKPRPFGTSPYLRGLGSCGCDVTTGCMCNPGMARYPGFGAYDPGRGLGGLGQVSLDQMIANAANWLSGFAQAQLPASAAVPPQYGSTGALGTQLINLAPWVIGGYLVYKLIK
jgi:hypothetical protein